MTLSEPARRRRCRALVVAIALGVFLIVVGLYDRGWASVGAGAIGSVIALVVYWRECGEPPSAKS